MAQQKSEDRVVPDGGVMPAQPAGSSLGGQGKAVPVEEAALQLCLPIATAEVPQGSLRAMGLPKQARAPPAAIPARDERRERRLRSRHWRERDESASSCRLANSSSLRGAFQQCLTDQTRLRAQRHDIRTPVRLREQVSCQPSAT
jgi:hypothetical protein